MSASTLPLPNASPLGDAAYLPIALDVYRLVQGRHAPVYCRLPEQNSYKLYAGAEQTISESAFEELARRGHRSLYLEQAAFNAVAEELLQRLESLLADESVSAEQRFAVLQTAVAAEVDSAFRLTNCDTFVGLAHKMGRRLASLLAGADVLPCELFQIAEHDACTFMHVTNVAGYAVVLADRLGISDLTELEQIAAGAILHDVGKRRIPAGILKTKGRLTDEQRRIIEDHPRYGYEELYQREDLNFAQLMMVYQHHEKIDGTGYPVAITGAEIHPWAKLIAVVDVFDAFTSKRPYRCPAQLPDVLEFLADGAGTHFDTEMVRCWIAAFQQN